MASRDEKKGTSAIGDFLAGFIQRNRRIIVIGFVGALVLVGGIIAGYSIRGWLLTRATGRVEAFNERYEALRFDINEASRDADVAALLEELEDFAKKQWGYPGARAYVIAANIHADRKNWEPAEKAWKEAARKGSKTYLAPISLFNAAVAAEEQGSLEEAIRLYGETVNYADSFPSAPRAQFSIGRLREALDDQEAAIEAYRVVIDRWPAETVWTGLANSRIITLR